MIGAVEHAPMIREIARQAYEAGAHYVDVSYTDNRVRRAMLEHAPEETLTWTPPYDLQRLEHLAEVKGAVIRVTGNPEPDLFADLDPERVGHARPLEAAELWVELVGTRRVAWSIIAQPNVGWASAAFGEPDLERLWHAVGTSTRLVRGPSRSEPGRRTAGGSTSAHEALDELGLGMRASFRGPGTDLTVGLRRRDLGGADEETVWGRTIPEPPDRGGVHGADLRRTEGVFRSTRPLAAAGGRCPRARDPLRGRQGRRVEASRARRSSGRTLARRAAGLPGRGRARGRRLGRRPHGAAFMTRSSTRTRPLIRFGEGFVPPSPAPRGWVEERAAAGVNLLAHPRRLHDRRPRGRGRGGRRDGPRSRSSATTSGASRRRRRPPACPEADPARSAADRDRLELIAGVEGEVTAGSTKRVASAVGDGALVVRSMHEALSRARGGLQ